MRTAGQHREPAGTNGARESVAERLLAEMHRRQLRSPVIVFASGEHADVNKRKAVAAGAVAYTYRWSTLFAELARLFEKGSPTG